MHRPTFLFQRSIFITYSVLKSITIVLSKCRFLKSTSIYVPKNYSLFVCLVVCLSFSLYLSFSLFLFQCLALSLFLPFSFSSTSFSPFILAKSGLTKAFSIILNGFLIYSLTGKIKKIVTKRNKQK